MRRFLSLVALLCVAWIAASCGDSSDRSTAPNGALAPAGSRRAVAPGTCTTPSALQALTTQAFGSGSPSLSSALSRLNNTIAKVQANNITAAQNEGRNLVSYINARTAAGDLSGTKAQIQQLIDGILCYVGLAEDTFIVLPTDQPQVITDPNGAAGASLPANSVDVPTLVTIVTIDPNGPSPLNTKLDKYPGFIELQSSSPLTKPVIVGVCPTGNIPSDVLARLRLGHQASAGFEITPSADASFLNCSSFGASKTPAWARRLASLFLPKTLYAATMNGGGVGGVATEFSPFGPVDPEVSFVGGVGGTSTEFMRSHGGETAIPGATHSVASPGAFGGVAASITCAVVQAVPGTALPPECRPVVTVTTHNGTILNNVPVGWSVTAGGGAIAPNDPTTNVCGLTFGTAASTFSDIAGKASVCWNLGSTPGTNTALATPGAGGDVPLGVTFAPSGVLFTAIGSKFNPVVTATGGTFAYDGAAHAGSGTCSNALTPSLTYSSGSAPVNAGSHTLTVTCGGGAVYNVVTATAAIDISKLDATATAGSASIILGAAVPAIGCTVAGLLPTEAGVVTCTAAVPSSPVLGNNVVAPVVSPSSPANYLVQPVNGNLAVKYRLDNCFGAPISATLPPTTNFQVKGATITVRCTLKNNTNISQVDGGALLVQDIGPTGVSTPVTVLSASNVFTFTAPAMFYYLNTTPSAFTANRYYRVTASWADGSTTTGYFYLRRQ